MLQFQPIRRKSKNHVTWVKCVYPCLAFAGWSDCCGICCGNFGQFWIWSGFQFIVVKPEVKVLTLTNHNKLTNVVNSLNTKQNIKLTLNGICCDFNECAVLCCVFFRESSCLENWWQKTKKSSALLVPRMIFFLMARSSQFNERDYWRWPTFCCFQGRFSVA